MAPDVTVLVKYCPCCSVFTFWGQCRVTQMTGFRFGRYWTVIWSYLPAQKFKVLTNESCPKQGFSHQEISLYGAALISCQQNCLLKSTYDDLTPLWSMSEVNRKQPRFRWAIRSIILMARWSYFGSFGINFANLNTHSFSKAPICQQSHVCVHRLSTIFIDRPLFTFWSFLTCYLTCTAASHESESGLWFWKPAFPAEDEQQCKGTDLEKLWKRTQQRLKRIQEVQRAQICRVQTRPPPR